MEDAEKILFNVIKALNQSKHRKFVLEHTAFTIKHFEHLLAHHSHRKSHKSPKSSTGHPTKKSNHTSTKHSKNTTNTAGKGYSSSSKPPKSSKQREEEKSFLIKNFKKFLKNGQLELANLGSVTSHDQAVPLYSDILTNIQSGNHWLKSLLGEQDYTQTRQQSALALDPFGFSYTSTKIFAGFGMKNLLINRVQDKEVFLRSLEKNLLFEWKGPISYQKSRKNGSQREIDFGLNFSISTLILPQHYSFPVRFKSLKGFSFPRSANPLKENFEVTVKLFIFLIRELDHVSKWFRNGVSLIPFGDDFEYKKQNTWYFEKIDFLLVFVKSNSKSTFSGVKIDYSTPREYFDKLRGLGLLKNTANSQNQEIADRKLDFVPYINRLSFLLGTGGTWTGFYSSRPFYKQFFQKLSQSHRTLKSVFTAIWLRTGHPGLQNERKMRWNARHDLKKFKNHPKPKTQFLTSSVILKDSIEILKDCGFVIGVLQHHDAITGTSKLKVMEDYLKSSKKAYQKLSQLAQIIALLSENFLKSRNYLKNGENELNRKYDFLKKKKFLRVGIEVEHVLGYDLETGYEDFKDLESRVLDFSRLLIDQKCSLILMRKTRLRAREYEEVSIRSDEDEIYELKRQNGELVPSHRYCQSEEIIGTKELKMRVFCIQTFSLRPLRVPSPEKMKHFFEKFHPVKRNKTKMKSVESLTNELSFEQIKLKNSVFNFTKLKKNFGENEGKSGSNQAKPGQNGAKSPLEWSNQVRVRFSSLKNTSILITSKNQFEVELGCRIYYGVHRYDKKNPAGSYIMSFESQTGQNAKLKNLTFTQTKSYYMIRADIDYKEIGWIELRLITEPSKNPKNDQNSQTQKIVKYEIFYHINALDYSKRSKYSYRGRRGWGQNTELIGFYKTKILNKGVFYTDSNGLDLIKRTYGEQRKYREVPFDKEKNFYPAQKIILAKDPEGPIEAGVYLDRPTAGFVDYKGEFEVVVQRWTYSDDHKGMSELVVPRGPVSVKHVFLYGLGVEEAARGLQIDDENRPVFVVYEGERGGLTNSLEAGMLDFGSISGPGKNFDPDSVFEFLGRMGLAGDIEMLSADRFQLEVANLNAENADHKNSGGLVEVRLEELIGILGLKTPENRDNNRGGHRRDALRYRVVMSTHQRGLDSNFKAGNGERRFRPVLKDSVIGLEPYGIKIVEFEIA